MLPLLIAVVIGQAQDAPPSLQSVPAQVLRDQAQQCRSLLKTSVVDFFLPGDVDREHGGYFEAFRDGHFTSAGEKFLVMQSRQLWFFSTLASHDIEKTQALDAARHGYRFLQDHMRDPVHGGYVAKVGDDGSPKDDRKHVYLNSFALYGLVAYHRASGDDDALKAAKALFAVLDEKAHDAVFGGYNEFFRRDWTPITNRDESGFVGAIGVKTYNTHLHLLESFTELYREWPDPVLRQRLTELLAIVTSTVRLERVGCNVDAWHPEWRVVNTPSNLRASYGHDVECAWLALDAAEALGINPITLRSWAEGICDYSLKYGYDTTHGGFYYTGPLSQPAEDTRKEWWVQAEGLVGMLALYDLTTRADAYGAFSGTLDFIRAHQVRPEGGWYAARTREGGPLNDSLVSPWQGAYHSGRALILAAERLERRAKASR